jgi:tetratricopeptide (TPR) repeat protein
VERATSAPPPTTRAFADQDDDDDGDGATIISKVPHELLRGVKPPPPVPRPISRSPVPRAPGPPRFAPEVPEMRPTQATIPATDELYGDPPPTVSVPAPSLSPPEEAEAEAPQPDVEAPPDEGTAPAQAPPTRPVRPEDPSRSWSHERPASAWLTEDTRAALEARAAWLEEEARSTVDKLVRARGLLACSEILATVGDLAHAEELAREARTLAPSLALAHRQARGLMASPPDPDATLAALDGEIKASSGVATRLHSTILAAEALRQGGDDEGAGKRLDQAVRLAPGDARAVVMRATRALGTGDTSSAALSTLAARRLPEGSGLEPLGEAVSSVLRLRGVEPKDADGAPASLSAPAAPSEALLVARGALGKGDVGGAALAVARLAGVSELSHGATWLAASLAASRAATRADSGRWYGSLVDAGLERARRPLVARSIELGDSDLLARALFKAESLSAADTIALGALGGISPPEETALAAAPSVPGMVALIAAVAATQFPADSGHVRIRASLACGSARSRALVGLGRLLAAGAEPEEVEQAILGLGDDAPPGLRAISLEMAARRQDWTAVSKALEGWGAERPSASDRALGALAAALIAERGGDDGRAVEAFQAARRADPHCEAALRALSAAPGADLPADLIALADELGEGIRPAITKLEAVARADRTLPDPTRASLLEQAHRAAPSLPMAAFLAERIARRSGDVEAVLKWVRERQSLATDPVDAALDAVREALFVADANPALATERLREAHHARPSDVALRELYERMAPDAEDPAGWREQRAAEAAEPARTLLYLQAALEHERLGDEEGALRCSEAAAAADAPLGHIARERAELRTGRVARLADELFTVAKGEVDVRTRREAYERLATLDATARQDPASALLWHRSILEESPDHKPSLRHVEQHLVGEGRDDELEPIAAAIANALRGSGSGECTAHAELAARLRMRGATGNWESSYDMVELAATERDPSLWALRMRQAHARARNDDAHFLEATIRLIDRTSQPAELAALLSRAGAAAARQGRNDEARELLQRATTQDPGDVTGWALLRDVHARAGDSRAAAEASEALARCSLVAEHQLAAWYDAGRRWQDDAQDPDRATTALEAAAQIDVAHEDLFDRLSGLYASRGMQPELASLLERRISGITDPSARLAMEVRRGRLLLEVGDRASARKAFESALGERPDDPGALAAFADLCITEKDWDAAEQALVRLARLLPTADEQRMVYARLGELYSGPLVNLARAEVALKEVLKRAPEDTETAQKLVDVYRRQNDPARAAELQQDLIARSRTPEEKTARLLQLAAIHEQTAHDNRRAEQTLEAARREFPQDVALLRALAEFYLRHQQTPAVNILLDRAGGDARRALAAGRFSPAAFGVLATVFDLRGKKDAAASTEAMLAALEGRPVQLPRAGERALDPRLDDLVAPEVLTSALRALLAKTGEALDAVSPVDLRTLAASPVPPDAPIVRMAAQVAAATGLGTVQVLWSPKLGAACMPIGARAPSPPVVVVGQNMIQDDRIGPFLLFRAIKILLARASALVRSTPSDLAVLVSAWLKCLNPGWQPQGINPALVNAAGAKLQAALPKRLDQDVGMLALEVAGGIGTQQVTLGPAVLSWGNRVAMLATGDPNVALDAIAASSTTASAAPQDPGERSTWVARTPPARELIAFGVTDAFAEARARLGLNR